MPSPRKQAPNFRSGHFSSGDASGTNVLTIIKERSGGYRIFNTGENDFTVKPNGQSPIPLRKKTSVDIYISAVDVVIEGTMSQAIKGLFECIDIPNIELPSTVRAGRYKGPASVTGGITIVQNGGDVYYRVLNSAKSNGTSFGISVDSSLVTTLAPRMSVDVTARSKISISNAQPVICIYDHLNVRNAVQTGRFSVEIANTARHKIIDLTGTSKIALYRINNSGEEPFVVRQGTTTLHPRLRSDQSFDFEIRGSDKDITVSPVSGTKLIEGIYEFFGQVN